MEDIFSWFLLYCCLLVSVLGELMAEKLRLGFELLATLAALVAVPGPGLPNPRPRLTLRLLSHGHRDLRVFW